MTNLTDKWKKGELPEGWYYVKDEDGQTIIAEYYAEYIDRETNETECVWSCCGEPEQALEKVPSYELWKAVHEQWQVLLEENAQLKKWCEEFNALEVAKENTKLKDLLKGAREVLKMVDTYCGDYDSINGFLIVEKINQVLGEE